MRDFSLKMGNGNIKGGSSPQYGEAVVKKKKGKRLTKTKNPQQN